MTGTPRLALAIAIVLAAASLSAVAEQNDPLVHFSTVGVDKYADGTTILDGERYALVWSEPGVTEVTFFADGTTRGGVIVQVLPGGLNGKCRRCLYEINVNRMSEFVGGAWWFYILDTRQWDEDGNVTLCAKTDDGFPVLINAAGRVEASQVFPKELTAVRAVSCPAATAATPSAVPEGTANPVVADIRIDGAEVCVSATNTVPYIQYTLLSSDAPDADKFGPAESAPRTGAASLGAELQFRVPVSDSGRAFFRVGRAAARE